MDKVRLKLAPPWVTFYNKLYALLGGDPDIHMEFDQTVMLISIYCDNAEKAEALGRLLPFEKIFGNETVIIEVIPANYDVDFEDRSNKNLFDKAFDRNPVFAYAKTISSPLFEGATYVVFKNRVVQFFNDNLNDIHGNISTLYEDIARELFEDAGLYGVFYCTDIEEKVGMPLGEWP